MVHILSEIRANKNVTQSELAKAVGISQETISQYETGSRIPNIIMARKIAKYLDIPVDLLFFGAEISKRNILRKKI